MLHTGLCSELLQLSSANQSYGILEKADSQVSPPLPHSHKTGLVNTVVYKRSKLRTTSRKVSLKTIH